MINESIAYMYAKWAAEEEFYIGKWVRLQCQEWIDIADGKSEEAYVCEKTYEKMCKLLKLLVHPDLQCSIYEGLEPYAWLLITAIFCTKKREDDTRYYVTGLLEIGRKNFKTFNCGVIFILLMLMEPQFSRFFSVAPDLLLSSELKQAIRKIIKSSPKISKYFKVLRSQIRCELTESEYTPLAYSKDGMDGKLANAFLA
ncbi:MAG: terminase, partial [Lachnospiraceae bacterium]|nr:terminase [Lachnospiraceae bacterium]